ncbi:MAG: hypothetical protein JNJ91_06390 [Flavobacteriales bacterium]|nr:hypothetical protein [Flavobacteriales bacterium]
MSFGSISRLFMSAFYAVAGLLFLLTDVLQETIPEHRYLIGGVLLGYGVLRFFLWQRWKKAQQQERP